MREIDKEILRIERDFKDTLENEQKDRNGKTQEFKIKDIIYVGNVEWKDRINGKTTSEKLYIVTKELTIKDEKGNEIDTKQVNNYYLGDKCIGGFMDVKNPIFNQYIQEAEPAKMEGVRNLLDTITREELEGRSLENLQEQYLEEMSEKLGISKKEILEIDEIDLEEELPTQEELEEYLEKDEKENGQEKIRKKEVEKLDIREKTKLSQQIKGESLGRKLGLDKIGITDGVELARVSTSSFASREGVSKSTIDTFAVIRKNGDAIILGENILRPNSREGTNPSEENLTIDNNDATVDREVNTTSYEIVNGNGREFLNVGYDEVSGKEIKYSMWSNQQGKYIDVELETNRTYYQDPKVRQFIKDKTEGRVEADNILNTFNKENVEKMARTILNREENGISEVYNQTDVEEKIIQKLAKEERNNGDYKKIIAEVEEEMQESASQQIVRGNSPI